MRLPFRVVTLGLVLAWISLIGGHAAALDLEKQRQLVNQGVIGVLGEDVRSSDFELIAELAVVLDRGYEQRILPIAGQGSVRAIEDLLLLEGVDVAIVQADVLDFYKQAELFPDIADKVGYLMRLHNREVHILVSRDIRSIEDLEGKAVNLGPPSSGGYLTASLIFEALGIAIEPLDDDHHIALDKLTQGEIIGSVIVDAKPSSALNDLPFSEGLHLLSISAAEFAAPYSKVGLTSDDYPDLISAGDTVNTLAVPNVMAVFQWPKRHERRNRINRLYSALVDGLEELQQPPFHTKWREVDPKAEIDGWKRF